jgi:poly-gamma-glutamate capsule biosynthesis protein CapA/YwtB (metallophosphatase superfamily)
MATATLFLCGDVMTGRGIDQVLPHPGAPQLFESYVQSARTYVEIAEQASGRIQPRPVPFEYPWGEALDEWERAAPQARIANLETAVTARDDAWTGKGIHYRMNPANAPCLASARLDVCTLANNHVLDWGREGLLDTLRALQRVGIKTCGAGADAAQAMRPADIALAGGGRVLVFGCATGDSGVPDDWAASATQPGVHLLGDLSASSADALAQQVRAAKRDGDLAVVSIHWGGNWGYEVPRAQREFAHRLIDDGAVDVVHGHSSHHAKGIEVHRGKLILYGCGDFLNDYEGIGGHRSYRAELGLMYFATLVRETGALQRLAMTPTEVKRFRVQRAGPDGARWLADMLGREGRAFGTRVQRLASGQLLLEWTEHPRPSP